MFSPFAFLFYNKYKLVNTTTNNASQLRITHLENELREAKLENTQLRGIILQVQRQFLLDIPLIAVVQENQGSDVISVSGGDDSRSQLSVELPIVQENILNDSPMDTLSNLDDFEPAATGESSHIQPMGESVVASTSDFQSMRNPVETYDAFGDQMSGRPSTVFQPYPDTDPGSDLSQFNDQPTTDDSVNEFHSPPTTNNHESSRTAVAPPDIQLTDRSARRFRYSDIRRTELSNQSRRRSTPYTPPRRPQRKRGVTRKDFEELCNSIRMLRRSFSPTAESESEFNRIYIVIKKISNRRPKTFTMGLINFRISQT
ncbi:CLUMA_CG006332, isoform A [Clunio marinus]|uniref:CLUMA_CG006332, isoform A n=1 Tax=Clunio marinus TaxID=568069 RepID=A0A1J1HXH4_9DIPT|nr:CLUMA_CG006332, isoform A [Clunio marinus]